MSKINAGVILTTKFVASKSNKFNDYVSYIDRNEATKSDNLNFEHYSDYMDNPINASSLFTIDKDNVSLAGKKKIKQIFKIAQKNGSNLYQTVISFDNRWLEKNKVLHDGILDELLLKDSTRNAMTKLLHNEKMNNAVWVGAIHHNTDNIHIHVATVEPIPLRECEVDGIKVQRGKFKYSSIKKAKSSVVNDIMKIQKQNKEISYLIRDAIVSDMKKQPKFRTVRLEEQYMKIYTMLPNDKRYWQYNMNKLKEIRPLIDQLTKSIIDEFYKDEFKQLENLMLKQDEIYAEAYGIGSLRYRYDRKISDLYTRMGNAILKEMKVYDKEQRQLEFSKKTDKFQKLRQRKILSNSINRLLYNLSENLKNRKNQIEYEKLQENIKMEQEG